MDFLIYISLFILSLVTYYKSKFEGKVILIVCSLLFLFWYSWSSGLVVISLTYLTYYFQKSKLQSWVGIILHLGALLFINFIPKEALLIKLGLSYYAIQNIGILLLTVRNKPQNFAIKDLFFANTFFAKFMAGPILLPKEIATINPSTKFDKEQVYSGLNRIVFGLFKKIVLADNLSLITNTVFHHPESEFKAITILIAMLLFTFEMYLNFSAYTDIALGVAKLFNIKLKENFNLPMRSKSISEYWRKTHISLIDWFTQNFFYYITFKFRKHPIASSIIGIAITFILSGIWHGAYIGFLIWGILNACYLIIEYIGKRKKIKLPSSLGWVITILLVSFANLFFVSKFWANSSNYTRQLFSIQNWNFQWDIDVISILGNGGYLEQQFQLGMISTLVLAFFLLERTLEKKAKSSNLSIPFLSILILLSFLVGSFNSGSEFIYMQF